MLNTTLESVLAQAIELHQAGQDNEAEALYRTILASPSPHAIARYGLGLLRTSQGRLQEAIDAYTNAITIRPDYVDAHVNLGAMLLSAGRPEQALAVYQRALGINPENAVLLGNLGKALQDLGRIEEALAAYRQALACQPDNATAWNNLGAALLEQGAWDECAAALRQSIGLRPEQAVAHANLGSALLHLGQHEEALAACRRAAALQPHSAPILATLGGAMLELGALEEATALCEQAIKLDPARPDAYFNLSHARKALNQLDGAAQAARQALALHPDSADYHFHLAHILLLQGDFDAGWVDWRWMLPDFACLQRAYGPFSQPQWIGQDISDKAILIYTEQGLGDIIQFARYLPLAVRKARRVIVAASPSVRRLLECIEGIELITLERDPLPAFDVHCPLLSLPRAFGTRLDTIPSAVPYLRADPTAQARWAGRIGHHGFRVGIVWAGNPATRRDRFRSPGLGNVAPLFSIPGVQFVVLQKGPGRQDCEATPLPSHVIDLGPEIDDLTDTAAIMSGLDLVITSCTGPLHLAGALGVPTWAMIPFAPYFPWLLNRTDTPWYPTMRLYRQETPGQDWSGVVARIAADLATLSARR